MIKFARSINIDTFDTCNKTYCISKHYGALTKTFVYKRANNKLYITKRLGILDLFSIVCLRLISYCISLSPNEWVHIERELNKHLQIDDISCTAVEI